MTPAPAAEVGNVFVLRNAREVTASKLDMPLEEVSLETRLDDAAGDVLNELYNRVVEFLAREQVIENPKEAKALKPSLEQLEGEEGGPNCTEVAAVADLVTRAAVDLLICSRLDLEPEEIQPELSFAIDLGADSLTRVDLVLLLEETLEVSVPDDSMFLVQTVGDAELFSVLFDRTREGVVLALGEPARDLTFDTPLDRYGETASEVARTAAARAVGPNVTLPNTNCQTLKDAVRLAFLTEKLRIALALAAGVNVDKIENDTIPERDLGMDADKTKQVLDEFTSSMDLGSAPIIDGHSSPFIATVRALAELQSEGPGRTTR